ncbi:MAG: hypothetical protein JOZ01_00485 [Candidatus Eremiobacteraeota bacterium]|nr:hypothetical protein [Candidatus Eremiobacteraeota bacterium]
MNLNPAQQRIVTVTGAALPLTATLDQKLVTATVDPAGASVTITANQATGSDVLHLVDSNGARADIAIRVAFNAGTIVPQTTLTVTGNPAEGDWLARQVAAAVTRLTQTLPAAQATIGAVSPPATALLPGAQTQFVVPVQITSDGRYFDQTGSTTVNVQNVASQAIVPTLLFYDDDPEHVTADGVLFRGTVTAAEPATLYYYHDNTNDPRRVAVVLSSDSPDPTSVQLVDASAGPNIDVMQVGHAVSRDYLLRKPRGEGLIVDLSQDAPFVLHDVAMTARQGVAGTIDLRVLSGGPVTVTVIAASPGIDVRSLLNQPPLPDDGHHRTGVFRLTGFGTDALNYTAGGDDAKLVIGDREPTPPSVDPNAPGRDYGDYGVSHVINLSLNNPTGAPTTAYLYFRPIAGIARGSFLVDGNLVELGCVRESVPYQITAFTVAPGQTSHSVVQTMTDGGSFYPVEIGVSATPPAAQTPAINASDGCFPKAEPQ